MKRYNLSTMKMLKRMKKNVGEVYQAENKYYRVMMNSLAGGGSIVRLRNRELVNEGVQLEKPTPQPVTFENENPYQYVEVLVVSQNMIDNWKWRKLTKDEYVFINQIKETFYVVTKQVEMGNPNRTT